MNVNNGNRTSYIEDSLFLAFVPRCTLDLGQIIEREKEVFVRFYCQGLEKNGAILHEEHAVLYRLH